MAPIIPTSICISADDSISEKLDLITVVYFCFVFVFPVQTGNNYAIETVKCLCVCVSVCLSVASSSVKTTGRILMKFGSYMQGTMGIMPVSLNFMKVKGQGHRSRKTRKNTKKRDEMNLLAVLAYTLLNGS